MNARLVVLVAVLAGFSALTAHAFVTVGYFGVFDYELATVAGRQVLIDLVIACSLILLWMIGDARERGLPWLPYAALTLALGSIGPLAYLIHRELAPARRSASVRA